MIRKTFLPAAAGLIGISAAAADLAEGWDFEDGSLKGIKAWDGASAEVTGEYAIKGKKSLKVVFSKKTSGITITPDVKNWSCYQELRFRVHNPKPAPFTKYRILYCNGREFNGKCVPSWGAIKVLPETTTEIRIDIPKTLEALKQQDVNCLQIYKGDPDTIFYFDDFKLYTREELQALEKAEREKTLHKPLLAVQHALTINCGNHLQEVLQKYESELRLLAEKNPDVLSEAAEQLLTRANDAAVLANEVARRNGADQALILTAAAPTLRIFRDQALNDTVNFYRLSGAGNEAESFQIVALPVRRLEKVQVHADTPVSADGRHRFPAGSVRINPVGYVEVLKSFYFPGSRTGFWPDILTENHAMTLENRLQPYFVTIQIPAGQAPGRYVGKIVFSGSNMQEIAYNYEIEVYDFSLPVKGRLKTFFDFRYDPDDQKVRRACYDTLFLHRLQPIGMYINGNAPDSIEKYRFIPRLEDLDYCLEKGQNLICLWYLLNGSGKNAHNFDAQYRKKVADFIEYARPVMQKHNAWDICFINGFDEIMHREKLRERLADARSLCRWIKENAGEDVKISNVGRLMDISPELMDYYFMTTTEAKNFAHIQKAGKNAGFYYVYSDPSPTLDLPGMTARIMPWRVFREGGTIMAYYSTYRYWALNCPYEKAPTGVDWTRHDINIDSYSARKNEVRTGRVGDGNLFYPARNGAVLPSTRVANLRDGIEDFEFLALLKELDPNHELLRIPDTVTTLGDSAYTLDQAVIDLYRRNVAEAIVKLQQKRINDE